LGVWPRPTPEGAPVETMSPGRSGCFIRVTDCGPGLALAGKRGQFR
jgi:hypothetical protein